MPRKSLIVFILSVFMLTLVAGSAIASNSANMSKPKKLVNKVFDGSENIYPEYAPSFGPSMAPGQIMGMTIYDYQHNGTMGRQVSYWPGTAFVHFVWMKRPAVGGDRKINYQAYNLGTSSFAWGTGMGGGKPISDVNGGYTTIDATSGGLAVVAFHFGPVEDSYSPVAAIDAFAAGGIFTFQPGAPGPPGTLTCEGWITGGWETESNYIWPIVDWQDSAGKSLMHVVACESPPQSAPNGEIQTLVYWRNSGGTSLDWPACGTALDSVYNIAPVVRSDKRTGSGKVAITWMKPLYYDGDLDDPCGYTQWQNDVVYIESTDYGVTWPRDGGGDLIITNITDYVSLGPIDEQPNGQAYTDLSAMYDSDGKFHVVWATALRDVAGTNPCSPDYQSRIWHWDDGPGGCISIVYDGSRPSIALDPGAWNLSACKMNISECIDGGTSRMYVSFTRFGAFTSANGDTNFDNSAGNYANGDIFVTGSIDGGLTYGEAVNLTNSPTPDCAAGNCDSDHWSSMAMYTDNATGLHIQYVNDKDAGGLPQSEGVATDNPILYLNHPCFTPATYCAVGYTPTIIGYPLAIAPTTGTDCTIATTTSFNLILTNVGNQSTSYTLSSDVGWMVPTSAAGPLNAGCGNSATIPINIGTLASEGVFNGQLTVGACGGAFSATINVQLVVACEFYLPENAILSTFCWSVGAWSVPRAGLAQADDKGNMYFYDDSATFMYDEGLIITMANDLSRTWFSCFDGSDSRVEFRAQGPLTTAVFPGEYEYTHGNWSNQDTSIVGEAEFWVPLHPDTCVLIERVKICNNEEVPITIHIGEGMDWDVPDGADGSNNAVSKDDTRQEIYQSGPTTADPEVNWYGAASMCNDIVGGIALENDVWIYPNGGYKPAEVGTLLANMSGFTADNPDTLQDMNTVYSIAQNVTLGVGECYVFCKVKAGSKTGLSDLQTAIDKGKNWIAVRELDCPGCQLGPGCIIGDADGSGGVDIDDVVYLIAYIFTGGPPPDKAVCCGDADGSGGVDIDDVVYLIAYIFTGGPAPDPEACNPPF
ncbi:MAG: dockerin type I repeat-containing protein [Candidatus Zixiibacteriota bacterium]